MKIDNITPSSPEFPNQIYAPGLDTPRQEGRFLPSTLELKLRRKVYTQIETIRDHLLKFGGDEHGNIYDSLADMELLLDLLWKDE